MDSRSSLTQIPQNEVKASPGVAKRPKFSRDLILGLYKSRNPINPFIIEYSEKMPELFTPLQDQPENLKKNTQIGDPNDAFFPPTTPIVKYRSLPERMVVKKKIIAKDPFVSSKFADSPTQRVWYYIDELGKVQGPFTSIEMDSWLESGYLFHELLIRFKESNDFVKLIDLFGKIEPIPHKDMEEPDELELMRYLRKKSSNENIEEHMSSRNPYYPGKVSQSLLNLDDIIPTTPKTGAAHRIISTFETPKLSSRQLSGSIGVGGIKRSNIPRRDVDLSTQIAEVPSTESKVTNFSNKPEQIESEAAKYHQHSANHITKQSEPFYGKSSLQSQVLNAAQNLSYLSTQNLNNKQDKLMQPLEQKANNPFMEENNPKLESKNPTGKTPDANNTLTGTSESLKNHPEMRTSSQPITNDSVKLSNAKIEVNQGGYSGELKQSSPKTNDETDKQITEEWPETKKPQVWKKKQQPNFTYTPKTKQSEYPIHNMYQHGTYGMVVYVPKTQTDPSPPISAKAVSMNSISNNKTPPPPQSKQQAKNSSQMTKQNQTKAYESKDLDQQFKAYTHGCENTPGVTKDSNKQLGISKDPTEEKAMMMMMGSNNHGNKLSHNQYEDDFKYSSKNYNIGSITTTNQPINTELMGENPPKKINKQKAQMKTYVLKDIQQQQQNLS